MINYIKTRWKRYWCDHDYKSVSDKNIYLSGSRKSLECVKCGNKQGRVIQ